ncbi:MAG: hypothetical protein AB1697_04865 [Pseudomonadota bacterium]
MDKKHILSEGCSAVAIGRRNCIGNVLIFRAFSAVHDAERVRCADMAQLMKMAMDSLERLCGEGQRLHERAVHE